MAVAPGNTGATATHQPHTDMQRTVMSITATAKRAPQVERRPWLLRAVQSLLIIVGVAILVYSSAASWFNAREQAAAVASIATEFGGLDATSLSASLAEAEVYNQRLGANLSVDDLDYESILNTGTGAMGSISIPGIGTELPIYHGTSDATLALGVGHLEMTSFPIGGASTHAALSAHHGIPEAQMFDRLDELVPGDRFTVSVFGLTTAYQVIGSQVVLPEEVEHLAVDPGRSLVTLITCTPLGVNTHRLLVTAEQVPLEVADEVAAQQIPGPGFPWWALALAAAVIVATFYFAWGFRRLRPAGARRVDSSKDTR